MAALSDKKENPMRRCAKIGKKWLAVLCAVVLFFTSVPMVNDSVMAATLAQTTDYLYLRSGPGTSYSQIMLMEKGIKIGRASCRERV